MGKVMVTVGHLDVAEFERGRIDTVEHQRDRPGRIGLKRQPRHVVHQLHLVHVLARARGIDRYRYVDYRLGFSLPFLGLLHALLEVAHAGKILVEAGPVPAAGGPLQLPGLAGDGIEDALAAVELAHLRLHLGRRALHKEALEDVRHLFLARDEHAGAGPGQAAYALFDVHAKRERREAGAVADPLGDILVERDRVAESAAAGMRRRRQETDVRRMPAVHVGMRNPAEYREILAVRREIAEVGRQLVTAAGLRGEKLAGQQAKVVADGEHSARLPVQRRNGELRGVRDSGEHRVEQRQCEHHAHAAQELAARQWLPHRDLGTKQGTGNGVMLHGRRRGYLWRKSGLCTISLRRLRTP